MTARFKEVGHSTTVTVGIPTFNRASLLRQAIESVLAQTYTNFRLIVSDNASSDRTREVVASFTDPRLLYVRAETNVGMIGNFNRLIALADTEFLMLLPDDDCLLPGYLSSVIGVLQHHPRVGIAQTAFNEIDIDSRMRKAATHWGESRHRWTVEPGSRFLKRSMTSSIVFLSTATFRTCAIREAGGMKSTEEPFADVPLFMRVAQNWDVAYLGTPLVAFRVHDETETARLAPRGESEAEGRERLLTYGRIMFDRRMGFLDEASLPAHETNRYGSLATLRFLADRAGLGTPGSRAWVDFLQLVRVCPWIVTRPMAWRFIAAQAGGRVLRRVTSLVASGLVGPRELRARHARRVDSPSYGEES